MSKFQRTFTMNVQGRSGKIYTVSDPLTVIFDISKRATGLPPGARFMVYNLSPAVRNDLQHDIVFDADKRRSFEFFAGYASEGAQPALYEGTLQSAFSYRDGPDVITEIEVLDGGQAITNAQLELTVNHPWDPAPVAQQMINLLAPHGVTFGAIGSLFQNFSSNRGVTFVGSTWDSLKKFARNQNGYACIDRQKAFLMGPNDVLVIPGAVPQLDATTGLIGTPRRSGWSVNADMLFEPGIQLMQQLTVKSRINPAINGTFQVVGISHHGIISAAKDGGVRTSLLLNGSPIPFNPVTSA